MCDDYALQKSSFLWFFELIMEHSKPSLFEQVNRLSYSLTEIIRLNLVLNPSHCHQSFKHSALWAFSC